MHKSSKAICQFYKSSRGCKFGTNCRFLHSLSPDIIIDSENKDGILDKSSQTQCVQETPIISSDINSSIDQHESVKTASRKDLKHKHLKVCHYFYKYGNCKFGAKCKFVHTEGDQQVAPLEGDGKIQGASASEFEGTRCQIPTPKVVKHKPRRKPVCQFFRAGHCKKGDDCSYRHVEKNTNVGNDLSREDSKIEDQTEMQSHQLHEKISAELEPVPKPTPTSTGSIHSRHVGNVIRELKRDSATDEDIEMLRSVELQQLRKRFPKEKLTEVHADDEKSIFHLYFSSSDPDWPYDVKVFELEISFSKKYPLEAMKICLPQEQNLPETVRRYVEVSIQEWIEDKEKQNIQRGVIGMGFRPFLKWLDKNLEEMVTEGLKQLQRELMAKAAGMEFIPAGQLRKEMVSPPVDDGSNDETGSDEDQEAREFIVYKKDEVEEVVYTGPAEESDSDSSDRDQDKPLNKEVDFTETEVRGTEVKLRNLQLRESASTMLFHQIKLIIQCSRCHNRLDIKTPPNQVNAVACLKCNQSQLVNFRAAMVHQFSSVIGYLDLDGCTAFDLVMQDCHFKLGCMGCSKETVVQSLPPGQLLDIFCHTCHQKLKIAADSVKFTELQSSSVDQSNAVNVPVMKIKKIPKDPRIQLGSPLPDNGTCKHYKKSFRWFRFPCCGKTYPCDLCHEDLEGHEMSMANRMICGHCCKEQPFALEKPCVACHQLMTKSRSAFWEGGKGCRDKVKMSRDDVKKYTNTNKTVSRRAQEKAKPTKKKENK